MPITIRHTPTDTLGQLAVMAGQAQGRQIRAAQDIQFTSMAAAAQNQAAAIGLQARAQDKSFELQRAAANQMARQRPTTSDTLAQQQKLRKTVSEAKAAGIYNPAQIKQMQIFADIGDEKTVRSILGKLPQASARQQELTNQLQAVTEIGKSSIIPLQEQHDTIEKKLRLRYSSGALRMFREEPGFADSYAPDDVKEWLAQQQQLEGQITTAKQQTSSMSQMLRLGIAIPEQMSIDRQQQTKLEKRQIASQRQLVERTREAGKLSDREELAIDVMRDREKEQRIVASREISRLTKTMAPFEDEDEDDTAKRTKPIEAQIRQLELDRITSYAREQKHIEVFLRRTADRQGETPQPVIDATGQRWQPTNRFDANGKRIYESD